MARFCENCGAKTPEEASFCPNCGTRIRNGDYRTPPVQHSRYQQSSQQGHLNNVNYREVNSYPQVEDKLKRWLQVLSFVFPILGWIFYFYHRHTSPKVARRYSVMAWIGLIINILIYFSNK